MSDLIKLRIGAAVLVIAGLALLIFSFPKPVEILVDGETIELSVWGCTVQDALEAGEVQLEEYDVVQPALEDRLQAGMQIEVLRAVPVVLYTLEDSHAFFTTDRSLEYILEPYVEEFGSQDYRIKLNGEMVRLDTMLEKSAGYTIEIVPPVEISIRDGARTHKIWSFATNLSQVVEEMGLAYEVEDRFSHSLETQLSSEEKYSLERAKMITVLSGGAEFSTHVLADTIGEALALVDLPLTGLDYTLPPEDTPLSAEQTIQIINVTEEVYIEEELIPFDTIWQPSAEMDIDQTGVVQAGEYGITAQRIRVIYQDGVEVSRVVEDEWLAKAPVNRINGYGTNITIRSMSTPGGTIEYWRAVTVYATSYSAAGGGREPSDPNYGRMYNGEFVKQGYCAVIRSWYASMGGSYVYVPGYGTCKIADIGGGFSDRHWIDLGYTDNDYVGWAQYVTIYFLTPVPADGSVLWVLP